VGNLGFSELAVIFVFVLLVFGPRRLPEIARTAGRALAHFRRASAELRETVEREIQADELKRSIGDVGGALEDRPAPPTTSATPSPPAQPADAVPAAPIRPDEP